MEGDLEHSAEAQPVWLLAQRTQVSHHHRHGPARHSGLAAQPFIKPSFPHARVTATVALLSEANAPMSSHFRIGTSLFPPPGMLFDIIPLIIQDSTLNASERMLGLLVWLCVYYGTLHLIFCVMSYNCMGVYDYLKEKSLQNALGLPSAKDLSATANLCHDSPPPLVTSLPVTQHHSSIVPTAFWNYWLAHSSISWDPTRKSAPEIQSPCLAHHSPPELKMKLGLRKLSLDENARGRSDTQWQDRKTWRHSAVTCYVLNLM